MHPAFYGWWKHARAHHENGHFGAEASCSPPCGGGPEGRRGPHSHHEHRGRHGHGPESHDFGGASWDDGGGQAFGVRRPLRFLAHKLDLDDNQVGDIARILGDLKTERAQADVDQRRTIAAFADALEGASFDTTRADEGGKLRVESAERVRGAVVTALAKIHGVLSEEQRKRFAYLIRTGVISV